MKLASPPSSRAKGFPSRLAGTTASALLCFALLADVCTSSPQTSEEWASRKKLLRLLDRVIEALVWSISKSGLGGRQQTLRLGHLTMLLSHIRHVRSDAAAPMRFLSPPVALAD